MKRNRAIMVVGLPFSGKEEWVASHSTEFEVISNKKNTADDLKKICDKGVDFILNAESCISKNFREMYINSIKSNWPNYDIEIVSFLNIPIDFCIEYVNRIPEDIYKTLLDHWGYKILKKEDVIQKLKWLNSMADNDFEIKNIIEFK
jgi:hypothetical protein